MTNGLIKINGEDLGELPNPRRFIEWIKQQNGVPSIVNIFRQSLHHDQAL